MKGRRSLGVLFLVAVLCAGAEAGPELASGWCELPGEVTAFLGGDPPWEAPAGAVWVRSARGELWGWPQLPRTLLQVGRDASFLGWRRLGGADDPWREDAVRGVWSSRRLWRGEIIFDYHQSGPRDGFWPPAWRLAWRPVLTLGAGWRLAGTWELFGRRRAWTPGRRRIGTVERSVDPWLLRSELWTDAHGAGVETTAVRRFGEQVALELGLDRGASPRWGLTVRRGPLLVRAVQGWHDLLGVWRTWEVGLCRVR